MDHAQEIRARLQLITEDEVDDSLIGYIEVLTRNKKTQQELEEKLEDFLGKSTKSFCEWLIQLQTSPSSPPTKRLKTTQISGNESATCEVSSSRLKSNDESKVVSNETQDPTTSDRSGDVGEKDAPDPSSLPVVKIHIDNRKRKATPESRTVTFKVHLPDSVSSKTDDTVGISNVFERQVVHLSSDSQKKATPSPGKSYHDGRSSIRCQFWPSCKKGSSCPFLHPPEECTKFPNCPFGARCKFQHPQIPCRHGLKCHNQHCNYDHSFVTVAASAPKRDCKFGFSCSLKETCLYSHPRAICKYGEECHNGANCRYSHAAPCRYGSSCRTPGCLFSHPESEKDFDRDVHLISQSLPPTP
jgi:hypothetical protein